MTPVELPSNDWQAWARVAETLDVPEGVHAPSTFSAVLASSLPDLTDLVVLDAGCGAGLVSIAALARGARAVIACDLDPHALEATQDNVRGIFGAGGGDRETRLRLLHSDFQALGDLEADIAVANPPQRPAVALRATDPAERHLHSGGGQDGLDVVRMLLRHLTCQRLWTTAAGVLPIATLSVPGWRAPHQVHQAEVPFREAWGATGAASSSTVGVWAFTRKS